MIVTEIGIKFLNQIHNIIKIFSVPGVLGALKRLFPLSELLFVINRKVAVEPLFIKVLKGPPPLGTREGVIKSHPLALSDASKDKKNYNVCQNFLSWIKCLTDSFSVVENAISGEWSSSYWLYSFHKNSNGKGMKLIPPVFPSINRYIYFYWNSFPEAPIFRSLLMCRHSFE